MTQDNETLHYMRGRLDSLYVLVENQIERETALEQRFNKVAKQVYALWVIGPVVTALVGVGYGIKKLLEIT